MRLGGRSERGARRFLWCAQHGRGQEGQVLWEAGTAGLAGLKAPPHGAWKDEKGTPIYFDGIDQSVYLTRKVNKQPRHTFPYMTATKLAAIRVNDWKFHFTVHDPWLGPDFPLAKPAVYNLKMDPGETYDRFMGGASPTAGIGALQTSAGRWQGGDTAWTVALAGTYLHKLNETFKNFPNIPLVPGGATVGSDVPSFVPTKVIEGKWPSAEGMHPAVKKIPTDK